MRTTRLAVAAAALLVVLSGCSVGSGADGAPAPLTTPDETAQHAAERYLGYLEDGDAVSAAGMIRAVVDNPAKLYAGAELLTDEVFAAAVARIESATVTDEVSRSDYRVTFAVNYTLAGTEHDDELTIVSDLGKWWVFVEGKGSIAVTLVTPEGDRVPATYEIAGQTVSIASNGRPGFLLFPGVYSIVVDFPESQVVDAAANPLARDILINFNSDPTVVSIPVTSVP